MTISFFKRKKNGTFELVLKKNTLPDIFTTG